MMTKRKLLGLAMGTMLLSGCAPAPPEPALLLVHGPAEASDRLIGAYVPVEPADEAPPASD
jgi:hypothetical protein